MGWDLGSGHTCPQHIHQPRPLVWMLQGDLTVSLAGLALYRSLQLAGVLQYMVRQATEVENSMTSGGRLNCCCILVSHSERCSPGVASVASRAGAPWLPELSACWRLAVRRWPDVSQVHCCCQQVLHSWWHCVLLAVERMLEYIELDQEPPTLEQGGPKPPEGAPSVHAGSVFIWRASSCCWLGATLV